nr:hypothetical protein [Tanacetum cinerariifolium]
MLFQPLFDKLLTPPPSVDHPAPKVIALIAEVVAPEPAESTDSPSSTTIDQHAPSPSNSQTTPKTQPPVILNDVEDDNHDIEVAHMRNDPYFGIPILEVPSDQSSSPDIIHTIHQASTYQSSSFTTSYYTPQFVSQGPSSSNLSISYPVNDISSTVNHNAYMASSSDPHIDYAPMVHHSSEYSSPETGLVVLVFQKGDNPIDAINHMMSFLTAVVTSRYPATNNQLRTSSNPRQQATINNGRVTIQPIQERHNFMSAGSSRPIASRSGRASGKQRVIVCYKVRVDIC